MFNHAFYNFMVNKGDYYLVNSSHFINKLIHKHKKQDKKNIMVMIYHLRNGGAERVASNLCDELSKKYNVILVTCDKPTIDDYPCKVERIVINEMRAMYCKFFDIVKQLKSIKKKYNITHTISFTAQMNYLNVMSKVNDETIISIRNYISLAENDNIEKNIYMNKKSIKYADKITVVSKALENDLINNYGAKKEKIHTIYNFVDKEKIDQFLKEKKKINYSDKTILTVGRLKNQKGHINLVRSFRYVVDEIKDAKLLILGQGPLENKIIKEIKKLKLEKNIKLLGYIKNPYIYMKNSKCFVLSSFYEGMPNVILEAMYCGMPIISTDCKSGPREILAPNTDYLIETDGVSYESFGVLVPTLTNKRNEQILAKSIIELINDKKLLEDYSNKSKNRIKDFSKEKMIKEWYEIIEEQKEHSMKKKKNIFIRAKRRIGRILKRFFTKQDYEKLSKDFFDIKAPVYDKEELELYSEDSCIAVFDTLKDIKYSSLLDIGCGTGHLLSLLSENKKASYTGLDISSKMIGEAKKKKIKNTKYVEGTAESLPFKDNSFDVVTCSESAHHYLDLDKAIKEAKRVLKEDGYYVLADKDVSSFTWYHNFYNRRFKNTGDCNFTNLKKAKRIIKKNGFEIIYSGKYYNNTHYIVVGKKNETN